jgi:hypothetical protein
VQLAPVSVFPFTVTVIKSLLTHLDSAGHSAVAVSLREKLAVAQHKKA